MSEINWNELKDKAHSNAVKHGFWEGRPSDKHFLCLVISELMEAVNAHRRNKFARVPANRKETIFDDRTFHHENKYFRENFEEYVKDTVEDELADAAIRLLDIAGANNLNLNRFCLQHVTMTYSSEDAYPEIWIDNKKVSIHEVAKNDGLSVEDFVEWFFGNNKENVFEGVVIHFTDFRY